MVAGQNVLLAPLSVVDGMYVLWRYKDSIDSDGTSDEKIAEAVAQFNHDDGDEYGALRELCGYNWSWSLAGLPLTLIHAGAYIRRFRCTFSEYLELYRESSGNSELAEIMEKAPDVALKPHQRAILTTWSISMSRLSEEARWIVQIVSMLGNAQIPEDLVKEALKESSEKKGDRTSSLKRMFHKVVPRELVFDSSLLRRHENETDYSFENHGLVRMFILVDMEEAKELQKQAFGKAAVATHSWVDAALKKQGNRFTYCPNSRTDHQFRYFPHSFALVNHFSSYSIVVLELSTIALLHQFSGACLYWTGKLKEAASVQETLLELYRTIHGQNTTHIDIGFTMHELGVVYQSEGKVNEAENMYRKSIHGRDATHGDIAATLHCLGNVFEA